MLRYDAMRRVSCPVCSVHSSSLMSAAAAAPLFSVDELKKIVELVGQAVQIAKPEHAAKAKEAADLAGKLLTKGEELTSAIKTIAANGYVLSPPFCRVLLAFCLHSARVAVRVPLTSRVLTFQISW
jgi:hypothetical protein